MSHNAVSLSLRPLQANADPSVISCMHNLSRRIAIALQHEERRCQYLTREAKLMLAVQDEVTNMTESESHTILPKTHHSVLESSTIKYQPLSTMKFLLYSDSILQNNAYIFLSILFQRR